MAENLGAVNHEYYMGLALAAARNTREAGEIPIGAVVVGSGGTVLSRKGNERENRSDPTAHAEILALREVGATLEDWRLTGCTIYVTVEPCPMCAGALVMSRIDRLVFGTWNDEYGAAGSRWDLVRDRRLNHQIEVIPGVREDECRDLLQEFMKSKRN